jgi:predicted DNA-binding protein
MRLTVSFSLKEETIAKMQELLSDGNSYRNKSHLVECAIEKFLREVEDIK